MGGQVARNASGRVAVAAIMSVGFGVPGCDGVLGIDGIRFASCIEGQKQCAGNTPQTCDGGQWRDDATGACVGTTCDSGLGVCMGVCAPGQKGCLGKTPQSCGPNGQWQAEAICVNQTCALGECVGECEPGQQQCSNQTPQTCDASGRWQDALSPCVHQTCDPSSGTCMGVCGPGDTRCVGATPQSCNASGEWKDEPPCWPGKHCQGGHCIIECIPGDLQCAGNTSQVCNQHGKWQDNVCMGQTCSNGSCIGVCSPLDVNCNGNVPQSCNAAGQWIDHQPCAGTCVSGSCPGQSCAGLPDTCGPGANESCCLSPVVIGGMYNRSNKLFYPATVSGFRLDRFEITVGRFRKFVQGYPASKPVAGAGAHPLIPSSGWNAAWDGNLPVDQAALEAAVKCDSSLQTWTDTEGGNEQLPMNCITWYDAFAFCAWDGGRLPTEAEWNYAAAGGAEQRAYPWSIPPSAAVIDATYAVYDCLGDGNPDPLSCVFADILKVGWMSPKGDGKWGQADLGGSVWEWNLDTYEDGYASTAMCIDCANIQSGAYRVLRSGSWANSASNLLSSGRNYNSPALRISGVGARCARTS